MSDKTPLSFEQVWDNLPSHLPDNPLPNGMEDRFWQRFSEELGPEEQRRQQRLQRNIWWESLLQFRWYGLAASSVAVVLLIFVALPHQTSTTGMTAQHTKSPQRDVVALQVKQDQVSPKPGKNPQLYQDMQMYENMDVLEKMKLLEQLPALTKGS